MKNYLMNTYLRTLFPRILSAGLVLFLFSGNLFAATAEPRLGCQYVIRCGWLYSIFGTSSGNYTSTVDAGNTTTYTISGLTEGTKYYFAAKAYDSTKTTESAYSNEVNFTVPTITTTALTADFHS